MDTLPPSTSNLALSDGIAGLSPYFAVSPVNGQFYASHISNDSSLNRIRRYDPATGTAANIFAATGTSAVTFTQGLAFDAAGNLYVVGTNNSLDTIVKFNRDDSDPDGVSDTPTTVYTGMGYTFFRGIAVDANGDLLVTSAAGTGRVVKVDPSTGTLTEVASGGDLDSPAGIALKANGNIVVADSGSDKIIEIHPVSGAQTVIAGPSSASVPINQMFGIGVEGSGRSIVLMTSTSADGTASNIVPSFPAGSVLTGMRADTDYIVTEHGVADLRHKDIGQKAEALTAVAAPEFRDALERSWTDSPA